ncbi:n-ethylammeline chlorohydrolase [Dactylonectria estremocensis]|uniref:N-ethylammeline chlorohydrolase n=1 Tax=Dactylonectria estremocensis TaxID=1079267 RepID=A0A9P9FIF5_9HYPO|nr:n-ethylammeline chlorohydrolase [Dactylonectria estremocensis]
MARIIIYNTTILTLDGEDNFYYPGTVEIENGSITKVYGGNPSEELLNDSTITVLDGTDKLGFGDELPLKEYLDEVWYPSVRAMNKERAFTAAMHSYCTAIKSGTTTVNDMYRFVGSLADAASKIGIRAVLSNEVALAEHKLDSVEDNEESFLQNHGRDSGRIQVWMGLEWMCTSNLDLMGQVGQMKKKLGTGLHIHLCESEQEVEDTKAKYGKTPMEIAYESGCLGPDTVAAHCVHLTDNDIELLAKTGTSVSYDPGSNAKLGNGIARLQDLVAAGVNVGMGIDAFECENSPDMFELMKFGSLIQRALHKDASLGKPYHILRMATKNGAKALGIDCGAVQPGKKADLIVVDLTKNQMFTPLLKDPKRRKTMLESHLVFGCNGSAVQHSIIGGKLVMKDFQVLAVDEEKLRKDMDAMFEIISEEMNSLRIESPTE